jgi:phenylpropionate dioxygenase-like ring-hydroxylating dioxygenase large terminal subunit
VEGDGTLLCSYHGWRFDSEGKCTAIPQVGSPTALPLRFQR